MTLRRTLLACLFFVVPVALQAQLAAYGKFDLTRIADSSGNPTSILFKGGGVGLYDDFVHLGPVRAGLDLRGSFGSGDQYRYRNVLAGVRVAGKLPLIPCRPYVQASVGAGGTTFTGPTAAGITSVPYSTKLTYAFLGGVDWAIFPHVDFRTIEIGYGRQSGVNGGAKPVNPSLLLVSSGLVVRFF